MPSSKIKKYDFSCNLYIYTLKVKKVRSLTVNHSILTVRLDVRNLLPTHTHLSSKYISAPMHYDEYFYSLKCEARTQNIFLRDPPPCMYVCVSCLPMGIKKYNTIIRYWQLSHPSIRQIHVDWIFSMECFNFIFK